MHEGVEKCGEVCGVVGEGWGEESDAWLAMGGRTLVEGITDEVELEDLRRFLLRLPYLERIGILFFFRDLLGFDTSSEVVFTTFSWKSMLIKCLISIRSLQENKFISA